MARVKQIQQARDRFDTDKVEDLLKDSPTSIKQDIKGMLAGTATTILEFGQVYTQDAWVPLEKEHNGLKPLRYGMALHEKWHQNIPQTHEPDADFVRKARSTLGKMDVDGLVAKTENCYLVTLFIFIMFCGLNTMLPNPSSFDLLPGLRQLRKSHRRLRHRDR